MYQQGFLPPRYSDFNYDWEFKKSNLKKKTWCGCEEWENITSRLNWSNSKSSLFYFNRYHKAKKKNTILFHSDLNSDVRNQVIRLIHKIVAAVMTWVIVERYGLEQCQAEQREIWKGKRSQSFMSCGSHWLSHNSLVLHVNHSAFSRQSIGQQAKWEFCLGDELRNEKSWQSPLWGGCNHFFLLWKLTGSAFSATDSSSQKTAALHCNRPMLQRIVAAPNGKGAELLLEVWEPQKPLILPNLWCDVF